MAIVSFRLETLLCLLVWPMILVGCQSKQTQTDSQGYVIGQQMTPRLMDTSLSRRTPEECYGAFRSSWNTNDVEQAFEMLTPRAQKQVAFRFTVYVGMWQGMGTKEMHESKFGMQLDRLLIERGIHSINQRFEEHLGVERHKLSELKSKEREERLYQAYSNLTDDMGPPKSFVAELISLDQSLNDTPEFVVRFGAMRDLQIKRDAASAWYTVLEESGEQSIEFVKNDQGWFIDQIPSGQRR